MRRCYRGVVGVVAFSLFAVAGEARTLQLQDYLDLERVAAAQISPDGKTIVYVRSHVNVIDDRVDDELWIMDGDGTRNRRLMPGGKDVRWSPDGTRIAYVDGTAQGDEIFVRWMSGERGATQITHQSAKPEDLSWSPDGRWIAFIARVPAVSKWSITLPQRPNGARWTEDPVVIDKLHYRLDGVGYTHGWYSHIFVVAADGGTPKQLTHGEWHAQARRAGMASLRGTLEWTPDSRSIVFSADTEEDADVSYARADLHAVDITDGRIRSITKSDGFWGLMPGVRVSPDGKRVAYVGTQNSMTSNYPSLELRVIGIDGSGERTLVGDLPGRMGAGSYRGYLEWASNGRALYYVVEHEGSRNLYSVSLSGEIKPVTTGKHTLALSSISKNGIAAGTLSSAYQPPEVVRVGLESGGLRTLTAVNEDVLHQVQLGRVEEIWYGSSDDTNVQGWIVYPPDFDASRKYPLILDIHGGPENMYEGSFEFTFQEMAAQGYVVLYTNPRGSTGYGGAYARAIYDRYPGRADYDDLMSGVDTVLTRGFIDSERMYVQGCSGGGTLAAWVVTQTDRFAAAAALCPIVDMISYAGSTDIPGWAFNRFQKPFWEDPSAWLASSAIARIDRVKTPTLVMVGENDNRTPVSQSQELYSALKRIHVPTKLVLFRNESHGTNTFKPSNVLRVQLYLRKWYGEWPRA